MKKEILRTVLEIIFVFAVVSAIILSSLVRGGKAIGIDTFSKENIAIAFLCYALGGLIYYFISKRKNRNYE